MWFKYQLPWSINFEWLHKVQTWLLDLQSISHYICDRCASWSVTNHVTSSKAYEDCSLCISSHTDSKACSCVASLSPSNKLMWHFKKMDNRKSELLNKDESAANKWKVIAQKVNFKSNINGVVEETADHWECWHRHHSSNSRSTARGT